MAASGSCFGKLPFLGGYLWNKASQFCKLEDERSWDISPQHCLRRVNGFECVLQSLTTDTNLASVVASAGKISCKFRPISVF